MPRMDGTGPTGTGPNGRGLGPCGQGNPAGRGRGWFGGAFRRGWGGWRGMGGGFGFVTTPEEEKQSLEQQVNWLKQQLDAVQERIKSLDKS